MEPNPFSYGHPVSGATFTGRRHEIEALVSRVRGHINVGVSSPRRYGKTSLLLRMADELGAARPRAAVVSVNVLLCRDVNALASRMTVGAYHVPGGGWHRSRQAVVEFVKRLRLRPRISVAEDGKPVFTFGELGPRDADMVIEDVYGLLASEGERRPSALVLDEFQALLRHGRHLPDLLKGLADEHPEVSLVIAGSQRHLMEDLVFSRKAPLYGTAERLALGPIADDGMERFLEERSAAGGKPMSPEVAAQVVRLARPVPNDIQRLAWESFNVAADDDGIDGSDVRAAFEEIIEHESNVYADRLAALTAAQGRVLIELARNRETPVFSAAFARAVGLASSASVKRAVEALDAEQLLAAREADHRPLVSDPFFAAWLAKVAAATAVR